MIPDVRAERKLRELYDQWLNDPQIAEAMGWNWIGAKHSVYYWRKRNHLPSNFKPLGYPKKRKAILKVSVLSVPEGTVGPWQEAGMSRLAYEAVQAKKNGRSYGAWKAAQYEKERMGVIIG